MAFATSADVEAELLRPLTALETQYVGRMLDRVERLLRRRIPELDGRAADDAEFKALVIDVEAAAAARVFRNPEAKIQESDGTYSYQLNRLAASGLLGILDDEWSLLGISDAVGAVAPATDGYLATRLEGAFGPHQFQVSWPARDSMSEVIL